MLSVLPNLRRSHLSRLSRDVFRVNVLLPIMSLMADVYLCHFLSFLFPIDFKRFTALKRKGF